MGGRSRPERRRRKGWLRGLRLCWRRLSATHIIILLIALVLLQGVLFWICERGRNPEISQGPLGPLEALWAIAIFLFSGADFAPVTLGGRILAVIGILEGMTLLSTVIASLTVLQLRGRKGAAGEMKDHIIILGWTTKTRRLIQQLQSEDLKNVRPLVLVADLAENPLPDLDVVFVSGDPTRDETLLRAGIGEAYGAIVLADLLHPDPDARTLLITLAVEHLNPEVYTTVEVVDPENVHHFRHAHVDEVVCLNQFSQYLILQSSVSHGLSRLFASLLSFGEGDEIYRVPVPAAYIGQTFRQAFMDMGERLKIILLAVERGDRLAINPKEDDPLQEGDYLFVVAPNEPTFDEVHPSGMG